MGVGDNRWGGTGGGIGRRRAALSARRAGEGRRQDVARCRRLSCLPTGRATKPSSPNSPRRPPQAVSRIRTRRRQSSQRRCSIPARCCAPAPTITTTWPRWAFPAREEGDAAAVLLLQAAAQRRGRSRRDGAHAARHQEVRLGDRARRGDRQDRALRAGRATRSITSRATRSRSISRRAISTRRPDQFYKFDWVAGKAHRHLPARWARGSCRPQRSAIRRTSR